MAKFCFPSCCFSCSCFSSPSLAQQAPSVGPSQQQPNAGPSPTTTTDLESFLHRFDDLSKLHDLIKFIEDLLKNASGEKCEGGSSSEVGSYIQDGQTFLEFVDKHLGKLPQKKDSIDGLSAEAQKILINLLKDAGKIHWVGAALSVVGFVLTRFNEMLNNKRECLENLKAMVNLGKQIVELNEEMPEQKQKLNEAVECIVVGCCMCISQFANAKIFRFLSASVSAYSLKAFQLRIDSLSNDLQMWGIIDIQKRLPKTAPQSQDIYTYKPAVGINIARRNVIRLLDLSAQNTSTQAVIVHGVGGIGKTTLADDVYTNIDLQSYKHCRIHIVQHCTKSDLRFLQEQILNELFDLNVKLKNCEQGRGMIWSFFKMDPQPVFLYIDNGLHREDLKELLPPDLGSCIPPKSRILLTTRNLRETDIFYAWKIQRQAYAVSPLPLSEARKILLKNVPDYNDDENIHALLILCGGVPLLLDIIGAQLAICIKNANNIEILEMIREGEKVEDEDISDRMVDFVYLRLSPRAKEAFLDIASFFCGWSIEEVAYIVGEEEFRVLEGASLVNTSENGLLIVNDIIRARGKKMAEQNRVTDRQTLLECLKDEEKLKNLKGIFFNKEYMHPEIEINENELRCMSSSLRVLSYGKSQITFKGKCRQRFKQLRYLDIPSNALDLPMEFEKLEHLSIYRGPSTQGMNFYEFPPSLRAIEIYGSPQNEVVYSGIPPEVTPASSLVKLAFYGFENMERLPGGMEMLTKLEELYLVECNQLRELPPKFGELCNLKVFRLSECHELEELPSDFGQLHNLTKLNLSDCSALTELPSSFGNLISLNNLQLNFCSSLKMFPSNFGQLKNLEVLSLSYCSGLEEWPVSFEDLSKLKRLDLVGCSSKLKETLPHNIRENCYVQFDYY